MKKKKTLKIFIISFLILTIVFNFASPFEIETQAAAQRKLELHAFYPANTTLTGTAKKYIDSLNTVSFAWGRLDSDLADGINTTLGENGNDLFYYPGDYIEVLRYAKSKKKTIQISIFSNSENASKILPYKAQRDKAINAITDLLKSDVSNGANIYFDGVVIDIEGLQDKDAKGKTILVNGQKMSSWYSQFLKELKSRLTVINKKLYTAVNTLRYFSGYDYSTISQVSDRMIIMAHDYEPVTKLTKEQVLQYTGYNSVNPIDSLAPIKEIQTALETVKKNVSKANLSKVMLQINFDAAQWQFQIPKGSSWEKTGKQVMSLKARVTPTYSMINDRVHNKQKNGTSLTYSYNNELGSPAFQYFNTTDSTWNVCIYENSTSVKAKMDMAKQYSIGGISLWSLSNVPDYTDSTSKAFGLDVWDNIVKTLGISSSSVSQTKAVFADKVVEKAVRARINKATGTVYKSDLLKVYRLTIPAGYKTLADLKQLANLEYLDLKSTRLTNVSALSPLKNLRVLYLQRNSIKDISPLKGLTKLEILSINGNKVANISTVSAMTQLTELYIMENSITDFSPVAKLKKLNTLYLKGNRSTNYSKLQAIKKGLAECDF